MILKRDNIFAFIPVLTGKVYVSRVALARGGQTKDVNRIPSQIGCRIMRNMRSKAEDFVE
jgi:hypothetical protein